MESGVQKTGFFPFVFVLCVGGAAKNYILFFNSIMIYIEEILLTLQTAYVEKKSLFLQTILNARNTLLNELFQIEN